ncbi:hypothetical protein [Extibacter muris]|uniref:hypothetical protein n=1 Tax=Extibacter muris TaxID=1796622 RepID=UPI0011AE9778|nr:hypothetical protein [Extibacter muris]
MEGEKGEKDVREKRGGQPWKEEGKGKEKGRAARGRGGKKRKEEGGKGRREGERGAGVFENPSMIPSSYPVRAGKGGGREGERGRRREGRRKRQRI